MTNNDFAKQIVNFVTDRFLREHTDSTIKEIASGMGCSEAKIRKTFAEHHGYPQGLTSNQETRESVEKSYGTTRGAHKVWVYGPSRELLARRLSAAFEAVTALAERK